MIEVVVEEAERHSPDHGVATSSSGQPSNPFMAPEEGARTAPATCNLQTSITGTTNYGTHVSDITINGREIISNGTRKSAQATRMDWQVSRASVRKAITETGSRKTRIKEGAWHRCFFWSRMLRVIQHQRRISLEFNLLLPVLSLSTTPSGFLFWSRKRSAYVQPRLIVHPGLCGWLAMTTFMVSF